MIPTRSYLQPNFAQPGKRIYGAAIGIVTMDRKFPRPVGDIGNAGSFTFPVIYDVVHGVNNMPALTVEQTEECYDRLLESCQRLLDCGVSALATTCGYAALLQQRLAAALPVPFASSSLMQLPSIFAMLGPKKKLAILAARGPGLTVRHLQGAGVSEEQIGRLQIIDLQQSSAFRAAILDDPGRVPLDIHAASDEISDLCKVVADRDSEIAGFVAECTNVGTYSRAIQLKTSLPVWDAISLVYWLHSAVAT